MSGSIHDIRPWSVLSACVAVPEPGSASQELLLNLGETPGWRQSIALAKAPSQCPQQATSTLPPSFSPSQQLSHSPAVHL